MSAAALLVLNISSISTSFWVVWNQACQTLHFCVLEDINAPCRRAIVL